MHDAAESNGFSGFLLCVIMWRTNVSQTCPQNVTEERARCHSIVRQMSQTPGMMGIVKYDTGNEFTTGDGANPHFLKGENPMNKNQQTRSESITGGSQFYLDIRYHQNSSWQGSVQRLDTGETINFRSALELMTLIEAAASQQTIREEENQLRNWKSTKEVGNSILCSGTEGC